jgi:excisionase family DNA binding protein
MASELNEQQQLLTVQAVAQRLGQSRFSVYRKIAAGEIPAIRLGGGTAALRVRESELEAWLEADQ